jgi:hypothetical protein
LILLIIFSSLAHLNKSNSNSSSPVEINDDATINFNRHSDEISFIQTSDLISAEENQNIDSIPKTIREEKLLAVSRLFQLCYRTVIPNRPPPVAASATLLPQGLSAFNPRPIGMNIFQLLF